MGDPGVPVMAGLLAVPVGVFLFVLALALLGGRWSVPAPVEEPPRPRALEPARPMLALPPASSPDLVPAPRAYGYRPAEPPRQPQDAWAPPLQSQDAWAPPRRPAPHYPYGRVQQSEPPPPEPQQRFPYGPYRCE